MSFDKYLESVENILKSKYCITVVDAGIDIHDVANAQYNGMSPEDFVNWFGTKYNLIENE